MLLANTGTKACHAQHSCITRKLNVKRNTVQETQQLKRRCCAKEEAKDTEHASMR
jgi:hypothetical protein